MEYVSFLEKIIFIMRFLKLSTLTKIHFLWIVHVECLIFYPRYNLHFLTTVVVGTAKRKSILLQNA